MTNLLSCQITARLLLPEMIWLEPDQIEQAKVLSQQPTLPEMEQWQSYLNALGLLGFEQWLQDRLPDHPITRSPQSIESVGYLEMNGFRFCLMAVEHVLDETVRIPQVVIEQSALTAHFYVLNEVSEEQEQVTVRGFCHYDALMHYCDRHPVPVTNGYYQLPLDVLDAEPNHLLSYCRLLQPAAFTSLIDRPLPADNVLVAMAQITTKLTQWLQNTFDETWQSIDQLIDPENQLSFSLRSLESSVKRGKLINLGVQFGQQAVALVVKVTSETEGKLSVFVQLHPTGETRYLMANLTLSLRSQTGETLQAVTSRSQDNYIQLKRFKGIPGTRFSIVIQLDRDSVEEYFEL